MRPLRPAARAALLRHGASPLAVACLMRAARVTEDAGGWVPDPDGAPAVVTPALADPDGDGLEAAHAGAWATGDLVDLVAWRPDRPGWHPCRRGAALVLGQPLPSWRDPLPVPVHDSVAAWFLARCRGVVPLGPAAWVALARYGASHDPAASEPNPAASEPNPAASEPDPTNA